MIRREEGSFITIIAYVWIGLVVIGTLGYIVWTNFNRTPASPTNTSSQPVSLQKGDINRDGNIDEIDRGYIRGQLNCKSGTACWTVRVGKTSDGDNPIYTADLDLNGDGIITEADLP